MAPFHRDAGPALLIVDDEEVVSSFIEELLGDEGYRTAVAPSAARALALLAERSFDLVVVDKNLPDRSGLELLRQIRSGWPALRVVIVTAYGSIESALEALRCGASDYILKPIDDVPAFLAALSRALGSAPSPEAAARLDPAALPPGTREAIRLIRQTLGG